MPGYELKWFYEAQELYSVLVSTWWYRRASLEPWGAREARKYSFLELVNYWLESEFLAWNALSEAHPKRCASRIQSRLSQPVDDVVRPLPSLDSRTDPILCSLLINTTLILWVFDILATEKIDPNAFADEPGMFPGSFGVRFDLRAGKEKEGWVRSLMVT
ncbi:hypothetical protein EDD18DRAFT_1110967 [Armillaria luteobubalina]|uniref:Uncharacterized protein n=1 Tax=Armillaria luteobubalina TaxID=153913 RepID=A0AA39PM35_9AGAR|nr:hypothetical protein EDD18DRAFT_1110967 [Armillaria luteobubalina]